MSEHAPTPSSKWRSRVFTVLKFVLVAVLLVYLVRSGRLQWGDFRFDRRSLPVLACGAALVVGEFLLCYVRFWILLRALGLPLSLGYVMRISFIAEFFNLFLGGAIGGDVVRLAYLLRDAEQRAAAAVGVLLDRVLGLLGLLCVGWIALLVHWQEVLRTPDLHLLALALFGLMGAVGLSACVTLVALLKGRLPALAAWAVLAGAFGVLGWWMLGGGSLALLPAGDGVTAAQAAALLRGRMLVLLGVDALIALAALLIVPGFLPGAALHVFLRDRLPLGKKVAALIEPVLAYRRRVGALAAAFGLSVVVQFMVVLSLYVFSQATPQGERIALSHVFFAGPPALVANVLPVPLGGLGVGETAFDGLLALCRDTAGRPVERGAAVFLLFRITLSAVALIGLPLYLLGRGRARRRPDAQA